MKRRATILLTSCLFLVGVSFGQHKLDLKGSPNKPILNNGIEFRADNRYAVFSHTTGLNFTEVDAMRILIPDPVLIAMAMDLPGDLYKGQQLAGGIVHISYDEGLPDNLKLVVVDKSTKKLIGEKEVETADIKEGLNTIILDEPIAIEEGKTYQVGYALMAEDAPFYWFSLDNSILGTPASNYDIRHRDVDTPLEIWDFEDFGHMEYGALAIFALINDIDGTWENAASTMKYQVDRFATVGEEFSGNLYINNRGTADITSVKIGYQIGDNVEEIIEVSTERIAPGHTLPVEIKVTSSETGNLVTKLRLIEINGKSNPIETTAFAGTTRIGSKEGSTEMKSILYERFADEASPLCPRADAPEKESQNQAKELGFKINRIAHHAGFYGDWLTNKASEYIAEHLKIDRVPYLVMNRYAHNGRFFLIPLESTFMEKSSELVKQTIREGTTAKITAVKQEYDKDSRKLAVKVEGETYPNVDPNNVYVNIVITESGIEARRQYGLEEGQIYIHNDIPRIFATGTYGKKATIEDGTFSLEVKDIEVPEEYKTDNMKVVVFLSRNLESPEQEWNVDLYDSTTEAFGSTNSAKDVSNQAEVFVTSRDGAIVIEGEYNSVLVYDLAGRQVAQTGLAAGVYIVRVETPQGVAVRKVAVR